MANGGIKKQRSRSSNDILSFEFNTDDEESDENNGFLGEKRDRSIRRNPLTVTIGSVKVTLKEGSYFEEKVDAIVNIAPRSLNLSYGCDSIDMLKMAGKTMQDECWKENPDCVEPGSIVVTRGHNLFCDFVFHVVLMDWSVDNATHAEQMLLDTTRDILRTCEETKMRSLSLPPMGTGRMGYNARTVVRIFIQALQEFGRTYSMPALTDVNIVICQGDRDIFEEFEKEMRTFSFKTNKQTDTIRGSEKRPRSTGDLFSIKPLKKVLESLGFSNEELRSSQHRKERNNRRHVSQTGVKQDSKNRKEGTDRLHSSKMVGNVRVNLITGSLVHRKVDVLVNETNTSLSLGKGTLSSAILKAAGTNLQSECKSSFPEGLGLGEIGRTMAYNLHNVNAIYHTTLPTYGDGHSNPEEVLHFLVQCCLGKATEEKFCSIAFPALGTGCHEYPPSATAFSMVSAVKEFLQVTPISTLRSIEIVVFEHDKNCNEILKNFQQGFENILMQKEISGQYQEEIYYYVDLPQCPLRGTREWFKMMYEQEVTVPLYWTSVKGGEVVRKCQPSGPKLYQLVDVDDTTKDAIKDIAVRSWSREKVGHGHDAKNLRHLDFSSIKVTRIQRVENVPLYKEYAEERQKLFRKAYKKGGPLVKVEQTKYSSGEVKTNEILKHHPDAWNLSLDIYSEINEHFLFHGTSKANIDKLLSQGIDNRLAQDTAMLGAGTYTAESSTKADQYSDHKEHRIKFGLQMLLVRVSLGEVYVCNKGRQFRRPPCKSCERDKCICKTRSSAHTSESYDSVMADGQWNFREFVVYEKRQVYPEYVISYDRV